MVDVLQPGAVARAHCGDGAGRRRGLLSKFTVDLSIAGAGQGFLVYILGLQPLMLGAGRVGVATRDVAPSTRRLALVATVLIALRADQLSCAPTGIGGSGGLDVHWRWTPTPEELLLARGPEELKPLAAGAGGRDAEPPTAAGADRETCRDAGGAGREGRDES